MRTVWLDHVEVANGSLGFMQHAFAAPALREAATYRHIRADMEG